MVFRDFQKAVTRRLTAVRRGTSFARQIGTLIAALYPGQKKKLRICEIIHESSRKRLVISAQAPGHEILRKDKEMIRAAVRREGIDIRSIQINER